MNDLNRSWYSVSVSSSGQYQTAVALNNYIYTSYPDYQLYGELGINTTTPSYSLEVSESSPVGFTGGWRYGFTGAFANSGTISDNICARFNSSTWTVGAIFTTQTNTPSDQRIKDNIQLIDDTQALQKLRLIEPKKYQYIDKQVRGDATVFGFIAQEVRSQFPEAIKLFRDYVPNILSLYEFTYIDQTSNDIILVHNIHNHVSIDDKIKLIDYYNKDIIGRVIHIQDNQVQIKIDEKIGSTGDPEIDKKIFIYGKEVTDFHMLNKDYLFTINYAATQ
jgi:hypothetical protein